VVVACVLPFNIFYQYAILFLTGQGKKSQIYFAIIHLNRNGLHRDGGIAAMLLNTLSIVESNRVDPTAYLEDMGFTVSKEG
jgi:hypothetical protein